MPKRKYPIRMQSRRGGWNEDERRYIGARLRELREAKGMSQTYVGKVLGYSPSNVYITERGISMGKDTAERMVALYGGRMEDVLPERLPEPVAVNPDPAPEPEQRAVITEVLAGVGVGSRKLRLLTAFDSLSPTEQETLVRLVEELADEHQTRVQRQSSATNGRETCTYGIDG